MINGVPRGVSRSRAAERDAAMLRALLALPGVLAPACANRRVALPRSVRRWLAEADAARLRAVVIEATDRLAGDKSFR